MMRLYQPGSDDRPGRPGPKPALIDTAGGARALVCAACGRRITSPAAAIEVGGRHQHECVNPHGWRWTIGCYAIAEGVVLVGEPESYWSWFPGFTWQIESCAGCAALMGWRYVSGDQSFHGLVVAHLREVGTA
jgi:hypothetical protein